MYCHFLELAAGNLFVRERACVSACVSVYVCESMWVRACLRASEMIRACQCTPPLAEDVDFSCNRYYLEVERLSR